MNSLLQKGIGKHINKEGMEAFFHKAKELGYAFIGYEQANDCPQFIILRHDVDVHLGYAKQMAEIEASHGVRATYFLMLRNPLYNLLSPQSLKCLGSIVELGHQVGLHFDVSAYPVLDGPALLKAISNELNLLKSLAGAAHVSKCVTFHKPNPEILNTEILTDEFFSGYNRSFFRDIRYIADSGGAWREESMLELIQTNPPSKIHFNSHPVWWIAPGQTQAEKLAAFLKHRASCLEDDLAYTMNDPSRDFILYRPSTRPQL